MSIRRVEKIDDLVPVRNAFMSVSDKIGLEVLVPGLIEVCPELMIYSTGGTYRRISEIIGSNAEQHVHGVSKYTGMPETEGGLVKSLHHKLFLGYLTETYCEAHQRDLEREGAVAIDLLVGNMYPFEQVVASGNVDIEDARGNIDVGGPSALRAAAKNWHRVAVVIDPDDYDMLLTELGTNNGNTILRTRFGLHRKAFRFLAEYNAAIADYIEGVPFEEAVKLYKIFNVSGGS